MWLEGADGIDKVDEYSDIDFWFDVDKEHQESFLYECISELEKLGRIDSRVDEIRGLDVTCFIKNDIAELPLVLFNKNGIIIYKEEYELDLNKIKSVFENNKYRILQMSRVEKYIHRNQYLEAYMKYIENVANPIVVIARLIYTPRHYGYELCHISDHLPKDVVEELESLYKVKDFNDIKSNLDKASKMLDMYEKRFIKKYNN